MNKRYWTDAIVVATSLLLAALLIGCHGNAGVPQDAAAPDNTAATQPVSVYVFHVRMSDGTTGEWLLSAFDA